MEPKANIYRIPSGTDPPPYPEVSTTAPSAPPFYPQAPVNIRGYRPVQCVCHNCNQQVVTRIEKKNGLLVWGSCIGIVCIGCFCGCCLIPFCIDDLKEIIHYCPNCSIALGQQNILD